LAMWAIDLDWLIQRSTEILHAHQPAYPYRLDSETEDSYVNRIIFATHNLPVIVSVRPLQANNRMTVQEGLLLLNLSDEYEFWFSLLMMLLNSSIVERQVVSKLIIKKDKYPSFVEELQKRGIDHASLFPGPNWLDGLSESLKTQLESSLVEQIDAFKASIVEQIETRKRHTG
jgi:hypothetical protein